MSKKFGFTIKRVEEAACEAGKSQTIFHDLNCPGLKLRVTASGAKSYCFEAGNIPRITIGDIKTWSLEDARKEAARMKVMVDNGRDPRVERAERIAEAAAARVEAKRMDCTLREAWQVYITERVENGGKRTLTGRHLKDHHEVAHEGGKLFKNGRKSKPGVMAALMPLTLPELTAVRISGWLAHENKTRGTSAAKAYRLLRAFVNWCDEYIDPEGNRPFRGLVPADAFGSRRVKDQVKPVVAKIGDCLQREQLAAWFREVRGMERTVTSVYLQALILTGARREEIAGVTWDDVDLEWNALTLRDKVEGTRVIPLTPYLKFLIQALPRRNNFVFGSQLAEDGFIASPTKAHNRALERAGLPHITLHGLRRTFKTLSEWVEVPSGILAQIMGHKPSAIAEKHYTRRPLDMLRVWHCRIEAWFLEQAGIEFGNVRPTPALKLVEAA